MRSSNSKISYWNLLATKSTIAVNAAADDDDDVVDVVIFIVVTANIFLMKKKHFEIVNII